jgi:hypothetical protein
VLAESLYSSLGPLQQKADVEGRIAARLEWKGVRNSGSGVSDDGGQILQRNARRRPTCAAQQGADHAGGEELLEPAAMLALSAGGTGTRRYIGALHCKT